MEQEAIEIKKVYATERDRIEALQGFLGILPGRSVWVTPPIYKAVYQDQPNMWPRFKIRPQDGLEANAEVEDQSLYHYDEKLKRYVLNSAELRISRLRSCLLDWTAFRDADGKEIPFVKGEDGAITRECIRHLPYDLQGWIMVQISKAETLTQEEAEGVKS